MNATTTLRPITADDEPLLHRIYASTREEELALVDWDAAQKAAFLDMQFRAQHQYYQEQFPDASFDIIEVEGAPAGRLYYQERESDVHIIDIALLPDYRNRGIGSAFLEKIIARAESLGLPVRIHVERFNPALRLYLRYGFQPVADEGVYYLMERQPGSTNGTNDARPTEE